MRRKNSWTTNSHAQKPSPLVLTLLLALCCLFPFAASARPVTVDYTELEKVIREELKATSTPGAALAIVSGDRVVYAKGFGVSNIETGAPVTTDMLFRLGSTTKMFTGAALVTLAAQGKLKLDEPISNYVTGLNPKLARLTAHQLLSHTAGMADIEAPFISHDDEALSRMVRGWKEDVQFTEPGEVYSYSSAGFWLAGYVLEEVSKKSYADAMSELLFQPLGMKHTTLRPSVAMTYPLSMGHSVSGKEPPAIIRPAFNNVAMWPAGSIYSSVNELSRFVIALMNDGRVEGKQLLSPEVCAKLPGEYTSMPGDPSVHYGYGLLNFEERGVRVIMHGGFSRGYGSMIQMFPEQHVAVILQTNKSGETLPKTRVKAMELSLTLKPETAEKPKTAQPLSAMEMASYTGKYVNGPQIWEVYVEGGKLHLKQEGSEVELSKTGKYRLSYGPSLENDLAFVPNARGEIEYIFDGLYSARKR
jgi:CubicO group peptidase (beta-lactamase class C family)